jgi:sugar lactone lactonase YvrE
MIHSHTPFNPCKGIVLAAVILMVTGCSKHTGLRSNGDSGSDALGGSGGSPDAGIGDDPDAGDDGFAADAEARTEVGRETGEEAGRDVGSEPRVAMLKLVAGGVGGPGDVDGIGTAARFSSPEGVWSDGAGNLFVADTYNNLIRKIVLVTGAVTTVAGSPQISGSDDGIGAAARFNRPAGITGDGTGNLFVADEENHTIRMIVIATGAVTTLAGSPGAFGSSEGTATAARFDHPKGLAVDGKGNLLVSDSNNFTIRKVVVATGVVTTLAGKADEVGTADGTGAQARFSFLAGIASDGAGNLFVADEGNYTIRKVVIATGAVSTVTPRDEGWFNHAEGVTTDGAGNLYIADTVNHRIRKLVLATSIVTTLVGSNTGAADGTGAQAEFNKPSGITYDGAGNLFVADTSNNTIRKVVIATGVVTTFAGMPRSVDGIVGTGASEPFVDPQGIASDGAGNLYVADRFHCAIRKVVLATSAVTTFAGSLRHCDLADGIGAQAGFLPLYGMTNDSAGNLFVVDYASVRKVVLATATVATIAGSKDHGIGAGARFQNLGGLASDGAGNLFVADIDNHSIRKIVVATGEVTTLAGSPRVAGSTDGIGTSALFNYPEGVARDGAGNLFVADSDNHTIRKIVISSGEVTTFAGSPGQSGSVDGVGSAARFNHPEGLAVDSMGNLFVADSDNHTVRKIALATGAVTTVVGTPGRTGVVLGHLPASQGCPSSLLVGQSGELYITDDCEHNVLVAEF